MGLPIVLMFWAVVGSILAVLGSAILAGPTALLTRGRGPRKPLIAFAAALPFVSLAWVACVFVGQGAVNELLLGRDIGLGDGFHCPLPNGYTLDMIDVLRCGSIRDDPHGLPILRDVQELQVSDRYLFGMTEPQCKFIDSDLESGPPKQGFFLLDAETKEIQSFESRGALAGASRAVGAELALLPIADIYGRYRLTWFDYLAALTAIAFPIGRFGLLTVWVWRFRRSNPKLQALKA